jgi:hypothetical protein
MMDDLFASSAAPTVKRVAVLVPITNDIVLACF